MNREESIKKYCLWCMNGNKNEVKLCPSNDCPLYKNRFGGAGGNKLENIIKRCLSCTEGSPRNCEFPECELYEHRNG